MLTRHTFHALTLVAAVGLVVPVLQPSSRTSLAQETSKPATSQADVKKAAPATKAKSGTTTPDAETAKPAQNTSATSENPKAKGPIGNRRVSQPSPLRSLLRQWLFADEVPEQTGGQADMRDPFSTTPTMQNTARLSGPQFVPSLDSKGVPKLQLRGLLQSEESKQPVGLMSVEGFGTFLVTEGETISLHDGKANLVLRIVSIEPNSISVEGGTLNQVIMVR